MAVRAGANTSHGISAVVVCFIFQAQRAGGIEHFLITVTASTGIGHRAILSAGGLHSRFLVVVSSDIRFVCHIAVTAGAGVGGVAFFSAGGRCYFAGITVSLSSTFGNTAGLAGLSCSTGGIAPVVTLCVAVGRAAGLAGFGRGAGCVAPAMAANGGCGGCVRKTIPTSA